jgi:hypothetical protein
LISSGPEILRAHNGLLETGARTQAEDPFRCGSLIFSGHDDSVEAMGVRREYLAALLRLSYLSPDIVRAILADQHPVELTPTRLITL